MFILMEELESIMRRTGIWYRDLYSPQEHHLMGSSCGHLDKPYTPIAVQDGVFSVEECERIRVMLQKTKDRRYVGAILDYYHVEGCFGCASLEPLDTDPKSPTYGQTVRDPVLVKADDPTGGFGPDSRNAFPFRRGEPVVRLEQKPVTTT